MVTTRYAAALDLGPAAAYSALAVVEVAWQDADDPGTFTVGHLHRFPPGSPRPPPASSATRGSSMPRSCSTGRPSEPEWSPCSASPTATGPWCPR
ncbi:MAG TPA: hypothetical protein VM597_34495 [Gemmataceae bacterium]|jgi:hypothetical protein|nr:hypothetical protein [Gemmataceae bacterium]